MQVNHILSLFDGISCGQIALNRLGIKYDKYFSSEIDKHAIKVTQTNYPNTIQLGDVTKVFAKDLPKIDLLMGGFCCQPFSSSGKQLNFEDPRGKLFFEAARLLKECEPKYFLFENVVMKKEYQDVISKHIGVEPICINSSSFSAQSRKRLYWTNIPVEKFFAFKNLFITDILETSVDPKYYLINKYHLKTLKTNESRLELLKRNYRVSHKQHLQKPVLVSEVTDDTPSGRSRQTDRLYSSNSKCPTLLANRACDLKIDNGSDNIKDWRTLTPLECEKLQTIPVGFTSPIPDRERFKCLGNCWTVDVICHILKNI